MSTASGTRIGERSRVSIGSTTVRIAATVTAAAYTTVAVVSTVTPTRNRGRLDPAPCEHGRRDEWNRDREAERDGERVRQREARQPVGKLIEDLEHGEARLRASSERIAVDADVANPPQGGYGHQRNAEGSDAGAATCRGRGAEPGGEDDRRQQEHARVASEKQRPGEEQHACEPRRDAHVEAPTAPDGEREQPHEDRAEERLRPDEGSVAERRV